MKIYNFENSKKSIKKIRPRQKGFFKFITKKGFWLFVFRALAVGIVILAALFLYYSKDLPDPNKLVSRQVAESTKIFARDNSLLYEIHGEVKRTLVNMDQINTYVKQGTVAVEDKEFYKHHGISFTGIIRSGIRYIINRGPQGGGGSTITQQLVKNAILTNVKSFDRKLREAILSIALEARFSKDEILQMYLNEIPYGKNTYGIQAASLSYFNKNAKDLSLAESAYLISLPQSPSRYNPFGPNRGLLDGRKNYTLDRMREDGYITKEQAETAKKEEVTFSKINTFITAPHFVFMVQDYLAEKFGEKTLQEGGLKVYTTLDPNLQKIAEEVVKAGAEKNTTKFNAHNAALVAIDPKTGEVLALVGSKDYFGSVEPANCTPGKNCLFEPQVNAAISLRQPGSSFKPYVYATAFKKEFGYAPASLLMDVTTNFGKFGNKDYIPQNYDGSEHGPVSMRKALAGSLNIPAVKTLALVGVENAIQTARDLGITSPMVDCGLSLVLGGCEVKLIDHVAAYAALANMGEKNEKTLVLKIEDRNGQIVQEFDPRPRQVLDPQSAYELISIMTDNDARSFVFGPNSPLTLPGRSVAAKTGTTQKWRDGWTLGFTPSLAAGVWVGNNDSTYLKQKADGSYVAAPIWQEFMKRALAGKPAENFESPPGIEEVLVDSVSGKLPTQYSPSTKTEIFANFSIPTDYDNVHQAVAIDITTGQPATPLTQPQNISYTTYTIFKSEKPENPNWESAVATWAASNGYANPGTQTNMEHPNQNQPPAISINEPEDNYTVTQLPLILNVAAASSQPILRFDVSVDGEFLQSITQPPYTLTLDKNYGPGKHIIAVKATDTAGASALTSVTVFYQINNP